MTYFRTSDLPGLLSDFGVLIVWGSITAKGIVDRADRELLAESGMSFTGKEIMVTLEHERFLGLAEGQTLYVEGQPHRVLQLRQVGDGALDEVLVLPIAAAAPAPARIAKGVDEKWNDLADPAPAVAAVAITAGSTVLVEVVTRGGIGPDRGAVSVAWGATALQLADYKDFGSRGRIQCWLLQNCAGGTANVTAQVPVGNAIAATIAVTEIQQVPAVSLDGIWPAAGNDGEPTITAGGATTHPNAILFALVGMEAVGLSGDPGPYGSWAFGFTQGQQGATPGGGDQDCSLSEATRVVAATGIYTASNPGRTPAEWAMLLVALRGN